MLKIIVLMAVLSLPGCTHLFFYPMSDHVMKPDILGIEYDDIYFSSKDGTELHGWWLHASDQVKGTVLFFHGNAENISTHIGHVYWLVDYGYDVVAIDYRGYGYSKGKVQLQGSIEDVQAAIAFVNDKIIEKNHELVVLGQSLGGSLSITAVAQSKLKSALKGVVVAGAFSDYHEIAQQALSSFWLTWALQWPLSFTVNNDFSPAKYIHRISPVPVLILHGMDDEVIPASHADSLFENALEPKYLEMVQGGHNNIFNNMKNRELLVKYLRQFM